MPKLIKFEIKRLPKLCVVGKQLRYSWEALESGDNRRPGFWDKCYEENIFASLEAQIEYIFDSSHVGVYLDWHLDDKDFTYIVGMLMKPGVTIPEGYVAREIAEVDVAVGWIKGKFASRGVDRDGPDSENGYDLMVKSIKENDRDNSNMKWCMEPYNCPRFTEPDENGDTIVDNYIPLN